MSSATTHPSVRLLRTGFALLALSLTLIGCDPGLSGGGYRIRGGRVVHFGGWPSDAELVPDADAKTFKALNREYGKDRHHVFRLTAIIPSADPATFQVLGAAYSRDKSHGFYMERIISDDGSHLELIPDPEDTGQFRVPFARDSRRVYSSQSPIEGADPSTFVYVPMFNGNYLTHDKAHVYANSDSRPLMGADGGTFQKLSNRYFRDAHAVWGLFLGIDTRFDKMPMVDVATFVVVGESFAKDKKHVYSGTEVLEGKNPATFEQSKKP